jgi:hypothetical protein
MSAFRGFDWAFCSDPAPVLTLSISLRSKDSADSPAGGFDTVVADCCDESIRRSSSVLIMVLVLLFEELSVGAEAKDNKCRNKSALTAPFKGADGENEFAAGIGKAPSRCRP